MGPLQAIFPMLIVISLIAVFIVLMVGVIGMVRGGEFNRRYGNKLMRLRVGLQALAVVLIVIYVAFIRSG
ncbi:MAG: twin transmembrane helix small protein [Alphaproteobacteria bacterium]|jgi:hypothetical protein|nr:twin transmembrane helix small protein [Alphaproteobacteria bacterium]